MLTELALTACQTSDSAGPTAPPQQVGSLLTRLLKTRQSLAVSVTLMMMNDEEPRVHGRWFQVGGFHSSSGEREGLISPFISTMLAGINSSAFGDAEIF